MSNAGVMTKASMPEPRQAARAQLANELETYLGDPTTVDEGSFRQALVHDEADSFPEQLHTAITRWGLNHRYIPRECGGQFTTFEDLMLLVRVVARRDLTAAIAHNAIYLGAACTWMRGTTAQKEALAALIRQGRAIAFGLTEQRHGSDILGSEVSATEVDGGYVLNGEKWLINNATRGAGVVVFARTRAAGGPRGFSLFLIEKSELTSGSYRHLPRVKTLGLRGADISGIAFDNCFVPAQRMLGTEGEGLDLVLKSLQVTRSMCAGLSLGAADTALRTALGFAVGRGLYGRKIIDISAVRRTLLGAFLDILICDCMALVTARGLHVVPEQFSVWSAVVKYFVPTTIDAVIRDLAPLMGAGGYLRDGIFQKVQRDHAIVGIFDGNTAVNLQAIALQLPSLLGKMGAGASGDLSEAIFALDAPLPLFDSARLALFSYGEDQLLRSLVTCEASLEQMLGGAQVLPFVIETKARLESLRAAVAESGTQRGSMLDKSAVMFDLAKEYCRCIAVSACVQVWRYNQEQLAPCFSGSEWLILALERLVGSGVQSQELADSAWRGMMESYERNQSFSVAPFQYARP